MPNTTMPIFRQEVIEIEVPAGSTVNTFYFPDQPQLRNAKIFGIDFVNLSVMSVSPQTGKAIINGDDSKSCVVNLYQGDLQRVKYFPLNFMSRVVDAGSENLPYSNMQQMFGGMVISWTKCFIQFQAALKNTSGFVVPLIVYYDVATDSELAALSLGQNV